MLLLLSHVVTLCVISLVLEIYGKTIKKGAPTGRLLF